MASNGIIVSIVVATAGVGLVLVACSSSSNGTAPDAAASGMIGGIKDCTTAGGSSSCPASESKAYGDCVAAACDMQYTECFGPGWTTGSFSGPCAELVTCTNACACGDQMCRAKCTVAPACMTCLLGTTQCSSTCKPPACASGSSGATGEPGAECARLATCCAAIKNVDVKQQCNDSHKLLGMNDSACKTVADAYKTSLCP